MVERIVLSFKIQDFILPKNPEVPSSEKASEGAKVLIKRIADKESLQNFESIIIIKYKSFSLLYDNLA
ncbi:Uncharacterised protein [Chlamydia trachomatis]|nr:Uncharacterised protein [Chlamydia trachomatis]